MKSAVIGIAGIGLAAAEAALIERQRPAGVILFARNIRDPAQLRSLTAALRDTLPDGAVILVDQEGGRVARLRPPHWRAHPPAAALRTRRAAFLTGALIGADCLAAGFDVACAPVLDLRHPGAHDIIGDRAFAADPATVTSLAGGFADGLLAAGIQPVCKHAPGHGRALLDSHLALPVVTATAAELAADLEPFQALAHLPWMMTAHICYDTWDAQRPATLSPIVIERLIRGAIGFDGILVSDDLAMHALSGTPGDRAAASLAAGCDIALHCSGVIEDSADVLATAPSLSPRAAERLAAARRMARQGCIAIAADAFAVERDALLAAA